MGRLKGLPVSLFFKFYNLGKMFCFIGQFADCLVSWTDDISNIST